MEISVLVDTLEPLQRPRAPPNGKVVYCTLVSPYLARIHTNLTTVGASVCVLKKTRVILIQGLSMFKNPSSVIETGIETVWVADPMLLQFDSQSFVGEA